MKNVGVYSKAIAAAVFSGLGSLYLALDDGGVTAKEWVAVAMAMLLTTGAVGAMPNKPKV